VGVVHSDLHREHLLVGEDGGLAGVLDFGDAFVGARAWDYALLHWYYGEANAFRVAAHDPNGEDEFSRGRVLATAIGLMSAPRVVAIAPESPAARAGLAVDDSVVALNGIAPRDVIEWQQLVDEPELELDVDRGGMQLSIEISKRAGEPLGAEVDSALFDRVRTCDNHCDFCFIYQLPKGMRRTLYLKDDDYRLSFLYGNYTTLTRFTEADLERVITERLSPLYVSIHATDPDIRSDMLHNARGAMSLRWLRAMLDHGIEIHGQIVVCPGVNDGSVLDDTLAGILDEYPELATVAVVPLGVSDHAPPGRLRPHTLTEAQAVVDIVDRWQQIFLDLTGARRVYAGDEYYLLADRPFRTATPATVTSVSATSDTNEVAIGISPRRTAPVGILTGPLGAQVLAPLIDELDRTDVRVIVVENEFFGGNVGVTGLMVGEDLQRTLAAEPEGHRYLLPDVCLSNGRFLDGTTPADLPRPVEIITTDGLALRSALGLADAA